MIALPVPLAASRWASRLESALLAVRGAGAALVALRGTIQGTEAAGGQLKTSIDLASEGWVLGMLEAQYEGERFLAEERFERAGEPWPGADTYWTVDALDGTRSYVEGFDGFCVQVAYVAGGTPQLGVIGEPVTGAIYVGIAGAGAWRLDGDGARPLGITDPIGLGPPLRFVDSTRPRGAVGAVFDRFSGELVECGSVGLKACRIVEGAADVYAKEFTYKLWDVAPAEVLLREVGAVLSTFDGQRIDYAGTTVRYKTLLAASAPRHARMLANLRS